MTTQSPDTGKMSDLNDTDAKKKDQPKTSDDTDHSVLAELNDTPDPDGD